jgi:signal transduction histidine kinase/CheY-like chemotaxis protein
VNHFLSRLEDLTRYNGKKELTAAEALRISYFNFCMFGGFLLLLVNTVQEIYLGLHYSVAADFIFIFTSLLGFIAGKMGNFAVARNLALISFNLIILSGSYFEGLACGNYLFFTPLFFIYIMLVKIKDSKTSILFLLGFTAVCFGITFFMLPEFSTYQKVSVETAKIISYFNFFLSMALSVLVAGIFLYLTQTSEDGIKAERDLAEKTANAQLQFLGTISHELRTPLNGIIGTTNLLTHEAHSNTQKTYFDMLRFSSTQMLGLINDVLDFSKLYATTITLNEASFSANDFFNQICTSFKYQFDAKGVTFEKKITGETAAWLTTDDLKLAQALNNLLVNALKFTAKGTVNFSANITPLNNETYSLTCSVQDSGIGIAKEQQDKIFRVFEQGDKDTTRKFGGTGLGLAIATKIVNAMGGQLAVQSQIGHGATFYFTIAVKKATAPTQKLNGAANKKDLTGVTILLAEDNAINLKIAQTFLQQWNAKVITCHNGVEAIEAAKTPAIDLLLLDLEMPEADGFKALQTIRLTKPNIPAIAFTAAYFNNIETEMQQKGFNTVVTKPFKPDDLLQKILLILEQ